MDENKNIFPKKEESPLQRLRTYKSDVAESMKSGKQSLARMVVAESARRDSSGATIPPQEKRNIFSLKNIAMGGGIVLFIIAMTVVALLFIGKKETETRVVQVAPLWTPIFTEVDSKITLSNITEQEIKAGVARAWEQATIPINSVLHVAFVKQVTCIEGFCEAPVAISELLSALPNSIPPQLLRTLDDQFFFGFHSFKTTVPVLILQNRFYDGAFLGMLEWESFMPFDLAPLFQTGSARGRVTFEDVVVDNTDVRILRNAASEVILLYSFVDRETIVITTNIDAFKEIAKRLRTPNPTIR
ncbi:MAG: hypothetical protein HYT93_02460 [Parcubacteria group bacterium]|nr:hypothetical protein [Parcubacteria group bacterium]